VVCLAPVFPARQPKEWISNLRNLYRYLLSPAPPIVTRSDHSCFVQTYSEFAVYRGKLFFVRNRVLLAPCALLTRASRARAKLELIFVGGLVPGRLAILLYARRLPFCEAIWPGLPWSAMAGASRLEQLARSLGIEKAVVFCGWLGMGSPQHLRSADVFLFHLFATMVQA